MKELLLIADASTLLNFLKVRRFDLLLGLGYQVSIVDAVYEEIQSEKEHLDELVEQGVLRTLTLEGSVITASVAQLLSLGLGAGEAFSFAAAIEFAGIIAIDDVRAVKRARSIVPSLKVLSTLDIVITSIQADRLTIVEADQLREEWVNHHKFRLKVSSFQEVIVRVTYNG